MPSLSIMSSILRKIRDGRMTQRSAKRLDLKGQAVLDCLSLLGASALTFSVLVNAPEVWAQKTLREHARKDGTQ